MHIVDTTKVLFYFMVRDCYSYRNKIKTYFLNYILIYPPILCLSFAYLQTAVYFGAEHAKTGTTLFIGNTLLLALFLCNRTCMELLFDLDGNRYIDYQATLIDARLILVQRIVFAATFSFIVLLPFLPMSKLILQSHFDSTNTSWPFLFLILYVSCLCLASYNILAACVLKNHRSLSTFWKRINTPLLFLGGFLVPWHIINQYSPTLGQIVYLNPFIYMTEGLRQAIIGGDKFFSYATCTTGLLLMTLIFTLASFYFFKKKTDYV